MLLPIMLMAVFSLGLFRIAGMFLRVAAATLSFGGPRFYSRHFSSSSFFPPLIFIFLLFRSLFPFTLPFFPTHLFLPFPLTSFLPFFFLLFPLFLFLLLFPLLYFFFFPVFSLISSPFLSIFPSFSLLLLKFLFVLPFPLLFFLFLLCLFYLNIDRIKFPDFFLMILRAISRLLQQVMDC